MSATRRPAPRRCPAQLQEPLAGRRFSARAPRNKATDSRRGPSFARPSRRPRVRRGRSAIRCAARRRRDRAAPGAACRTRRGEVGGLVARTPGGPGRDRRGIARRRRDRSRCAAWRRRPPSRARWTARRRAAAKNRRRCRSRGRGGRARIFAVRISSTHRIELQRVAVFVGEQDVDARLRKRRLDQAQGRGQQQQVAQTGVVPDGEDAAHRFRIDRALRGAAARAGAGPSFRAGGFLPPRSKLFASVFQASTAPILSLCIIGLCPRSPGAPTARSRA